MTIRFHYKNITAIINRPHLVYLTVIVLTSVFFLGSCSSRPTEVSNTNTLAAIFPAYYDATIPPNIAPLNFSIQEPGSKFRVEISSDNHETLSIAQSSSNIKIPIAKWKNILSKNSGGKIHVDIWVFNNKWLKYKQITYSVAAEPIDPYLAYRKVDAVYLKWRDMGIYQRHLENFDETPIIENTSSDKGCINCHSFSKKDPSKMLLHFRIINAATLIWDEGKLSKINTKSPEAVSGGIYPAWHPDGKHIAFSVGKLNPHLTTRSNKVVDVSDQVSDIIIYNIEKEKVILLPNLSTSRRENMPVWSPDGKRLYFISAPEAIEGNTESRLHTKYDLMFTSYDTEMDTCGPIETLISSTETGLSISMPAISPDGKYIVCAMSDYGYFTIFHKMSDLYLINTETKTYNKLTINSPSAESYSSWSSNGRWLVFSSKRIDDVYTRPFIAYFDSSGTMHPPFVLPQKDPESYNFILSNYNRPELITGKVEVSPIEIRNVISENNQK